MRNKKTTFLIAASLLVAASAFGQRNVTLTLNTATVPDTTSITSLIEVRGNNNGSAPDTLVDGSIIDWSDVSTLEPVNIGGDYWQLNFQIEEDDTLTFKFFSQQAQDNGVNGWEADPNPMLFPASGDTTLPLHYFESQSEWHGVSGDRGDYDWRPFESKQDSVAVWFRVVMLGTEADTDLYDSGLSSPDQVIAIRGAPLVDPNDSTMVGPLDWGDSYEVNRESSNDEHLAHDIYSAVAYYPASLAGTRQDYKFVIGHLQPDSSYQVGWEEGNTTGNRGFNVPAQDTTLHWVYFGDTAPSPNLPVLSNIVFGTSLEALETIGLFDTARQDTLWVFGDFNGWQNCRTESPDDCYMFRDPGSTTYGAAVPIERPAGVALGYKFFLDFNDVAFEAEFGVPPPSGWEEGHLTGINRRFVFEGSAQQVLPLAYFNDVTPNNILGDGTSVTVKLAVDMTDALTNQAQPFDPAAGDTVSIHLGDPIWAHTQGIDGTDHTIPLHNDLQLTDDDGDDVYVGDFVISGPSYNILTFKYMYGQGGTYFQEPGSDTQSPGRNRAHFIKKNADGSYPAEYALDTLRFKIGPGPLDYERNPDIYTAIEEVSTEVPDAIWLGGNYPNPFNPTTTFEYGLTEQAHVRIRVYDVVGRMVSTLVDGVQQAATYSITFDASHLASGVYFYRLETTKQVVTKRMLLVK